MTRTAKARSWIAAVGQAGPALAVVLLFVVLSASNGEFLSKDNLLNVAEQSVTLGIVSAAVTLVIISGGFDLSVAAIAAVSGMVAAALGGEVGVPVGILAGLLAGALLGTANGFLVTAGRINSFLATLGTTFIITGLAAVATGGALVANTSSSFTWLGRGEIAGIPVSVFVLAAFAIFCGLLLARTVFGRSVYAIGSNEMVAGMSGIRVDLVRTAVFTLSGLAAGLAGILTASQLGQGQLKSATGLELDAIAAVAIGGTSILGGSGSVWRTVIGVALLALVDNGLNLLGVDPAFQYLASGAIIVLALGLDSLRRSGEPA